MQRLLLLALLVLSTAAASAAQDKSADYEDELRNGDAYLQRHMYEQALQAYKHAYSLKDKRSYDALVGIALAYRGLAAHKSVLDLCADGLKLAGEDKAHQAQIHNLRGAALAALSDKPSDKKLQEAESEFRAALAADESFAAARLNLGIALLRMGHDPDGIRELKAYVDSAPKDVDLERNNMDWPQFLDASRRVLRLFNVTVYPTYIVLDGEGIVRARRSGFGLDTHSWLEREINKTLKDR